MPTGPNLTEAAKLAAVNEVTGLLLQGQGLVVHETETAWLRRALNQSKIDARFVAAAPADVPGGKDVLVELGNGVSLTFGTVISSGKATADFFEGPAELPTPLHGDPRVTYDISTTAVYESSQEILVEIEYEEGDFKDESLLKLLHQEADQWVDRTIGLDTSANLIRAKVDSLSNFVIVAGADVVGRHVFYNNSAFDGDDPEANAKDDDAIAPDKTALLGGAAATWANYTNYNRGLNGIMVDVDGLTDAANLSVEDFRFSVSHNNPVGNSSDPTDWTAVVGPRSITVRPGEGVEGSDRVTILWPDNAIERQWLQVTVMVTENTGLATPDIFYFGNAPGEAGDQAINTIVNATDEIVARNFQHSAVDPALVDDKYDYNRDGLVNGTDQIIARDNQTNPLTMLRLITAPAVDLALKQAVVVDQDASEALSAALDWQYEYESMRSKSAKDKDVEATVDLLLATDWE